ncbi:hypothetical protein BGX34_004097, partial [Mortierella sp. NVP85]
MQNLPGLSFFDGLSRSRNPGQGSRLSSATSPPSTPLQDAASLRGVKGNDPQSISGASIHNPAGDGLRRGSVEPLDDPLSSSASSTGSFSSSSSSLPAASFSRRAATVSAGSSSSITSTQTSSRRAANASTGRSSILSKDSIFSSPILGRRPSTVADNSVHGGTGGGRDRSGSTASQEGAEPTAKDVGLMAQGTQAYTLLKRIQEHPIELADIIRMLVTKKAILILPTCTEPSADPAPTRATFEDHVIIPESNHGESLFVTLSGIRGVLRPASSSITILGMATGQDFGTIATDASGPTKRSFFDNIAKSEGGLASSADAPASNELRLVNSSKRPVVIFVESVGSVHALLVDTTMPKPEGDAAPTPIVPLSTGIATVKELSAAATRRTPSSSSSIRSFNTEDTPPLPKLPRIASDVPLQWDGAVKDLESFVAKLKKSPLPTADRYANEFQRKYDDMRHRFQAYGLASGLAKHHNWSDQDFDEVQQWIEAWLCREMYPIIFPHSASHGINRQDFLQDEQLQAKIAALNFMDLTLEHLGFVLEHPEDVEHIAQVVRDGGVEMQKLASVREPAVQELLHEIEETKDGTTADASGVAAKRQSKRASIPKIFMEGVIPGLGSANSTDGVQSAKTPVDNGDDRPSKVGDQVEPTKESGSDDTATTRDQQVEPAAEESNVESPKGDGQADQTEAETKTTTSTSKDESSSGDVEAPKQTSEVETTGGLSSGRPETNVAPAVEAATRTHHTASSSTSSTTPKGQYSADVLLPLLIFSVVKSNPPMLISNLRYIQRFKVQDHLAGELAYCLTNMMAVVSFLETLDPKALGLSDEIKVM